MKIPIYITRASNVRERKGPWEGASRPQLDRAPIEPVRTFPKPGNQGVSSDMANVNLEIGHFYGSRGRCGREDHTIPERPNALEDWKPFRIAVTRSIEGRAIWLQNTFFAIDSPAPVVESNSICAAANQTGTDSMEPLTLFFNPSNASRKAIRFRNIDTGDTLTVTSSTLCRTHYR